MKMDRNQNANGLGKYAVINLRKLAELGPVAPLSRPDTLIGAALNTLEKAGVLEWGFVGAPDEFFLVKLKDRHAEACLRGYAESAAATDPEWASEVFELASRSGLNSPHCKHPD